ncbi:MAG TPA: sigma-70 family RNA polymerase sigma factor [Thermoanaerobaculia bacterium]|nr:sigma-70 family RNA polymerase sigma factor [Thermoanaerobaculia bacterium]
MLSPESYARDAALVAGLRAGDDDAFEALLQTYSARLLRLARRFLASEEDARDALQDAMVSVFRSIGSFESGSRLSTWLHRIVVNACLMKLRTRRRRLDEVEVEIDIEEYLPRFHQDGHQVEPSQPWTESAEAMLEREELRELVRASIEKLPDSYRIVLHLRDIEEMSTEETAEILGITPNAVKIRLHRARQALRTLLDAPMRTLHA